MKKIELYDIVEKNKFYYLVLELPVCDNTYFNLSTEKIVTYGLTKLMRVVIGNDGFWHIGEDKFGKACEGGYSNTRNYNLYQKHPHNKKYFFFQKNNFCKSRVLSYEVKKETL